MSQRPEIVVFDIGNVLLGWDPETWFTDRIGAERTQAVFDATGILHANERVDLGHPFSDTILSLATAYPDWAEEVQMWHDNWLSLASPAIPHSVRLLRALRAREVPVYALSNFGVQTFEIALSAYPFLAEFDRSYISGHMQVIKPDPEIYARLEDDSGAAPGTLLFADDRPDNIAAAAARGWHTHLFTDPQGWADRLVAEGLLSKADAA